MDDAGKYALLVRRVPRQLQWLVEAGTVHPLGRYHARGHCTPTFLRSANRLIGLAAANRQDHPLCWCHRGAFR
jgi:hypothetical protein